MLGLVGGGVEELKRGTVRVLAVASGGGHWVQLLRAARAFDGLDLAFATVHPAYAEDVVDHRFYAVRDATRWDRIGSVRLALRMLWILVRERPDVVFTTGAAPGSFAVIFGHFLGARTIWLDSIANIEGMSFSSGLVRKYASHWMTQWAHLEAAEGPEFAGGVF